MKTSCLKSLSPKLYFLSPTAGFSLIELLVVIAIMIILIGVGVASYNNFNQNQILSQAASTLVTNLRDTQNRALSGEKDCSIGVCGGTTAGCGNDSDGSEKVLDGWLVMFYNSPSRYLIYGRCGGFGASGVNFSVTTVTLPEEVEILGFPSCVPSCNPILFKSLTLSTNIPVSTTMTLQLQDNPSKLKTITIYTSGEIKLQ